MNLKEILPTSEQLKLTRGIEAELLQRRRKGLIGGLVAVLGAVLQVLLLTIEKDYPQKVGAALRTVFKNPLALISFPELIGLGVIAVGVAVYFALRWTSVLAKESKEPFQYTFWIEAFEEIKGTPGDRFRVDAIDRLKLLDRDLMERLSMRIRRLSLLDAERDVASAKREALNSHIQVRGSYAVKQDRNNEWLLEVMARIRIGPAGRPEALIDPVTISVDESQASKPGGLLTADKYTQLVERLYSKLATEIYKQILGDVNAKGDLFPSNYLRAVALFHEAIDFERSNTVDAYDHAIKLYRESKHYFDIRIFGRLPKMLMALPRIPFIPVWRLVKRSVLAEANSRTGLARALIYRSMVSALAGRDQNQLFEAPAELRTVIDNLDRLQRIMRRTKKFPEAPAATDMTTKDSGPRNTALGQSLMGFLTFPDDSPFRRGWQMFNQIRKDLAGAHAVAALGFVYLGDVETARDHLQRAEATEPAFTEINPVWFLARAETDSNIGSRLLLLRRATELDPKFEIAQYRLAQALEIRLRSRDEIRKGRIENVIKQYEEVLAINPGNIGALCAQGYLYWLSGDLQSAQDKFAEGCETKAIVRQTFIGDLYYGLARIAAEQGRINSSYELYGQAIHAYPGVAAYSPVKTTTLLNNYQYISQNTLARYRSFKETADKTITKLRDLPDGVERLDADKIDVSKRIINVVSSAVTNDYANACLNYFIRFGDRKCREEAITLYEQSVKLDPENAVAYYNLSVGYLWSDERSDERIRTCLERAEKLTPAWPELLMALARHKSEQGSRKEKGLRDQIKEVESQKTEEQKTAVAKAVPLVQPDPKKANVVAQTPAPSAKIEELDSRLDQLKKELASVQDLKTGSATTVRTIINQTKWSSAVRDETLGPQRVKELLSWNVERGRLNENDLLALQVWADVLAYDEESPDSLIAAEQLCRYVLEFYPKQFDTIQILSRIYETLYKLTTEKKMAGDAASYNSQKAECDNAIKQEINRWLIDDIIHYAALLWATQFTKVFDLPLQQRLVEDAIERSNGQNGAHYYLLGYLYYQAGEYSRAAGSFEKAIEKIPDDPTYFNFLGASYFSTERYGDAARAYRKAANLPLNFQSAQSYANLASAHEQLNEWQESIKAYRKAIGLNPENAEYRLRLANTFNARGNQTFEREDFESAVKDYLAAISQAPQTAVYYSNLALAYQGLKEWAKAVDAWDKASANDPANDDYKHQRINAQGNFELEKNNFQQAATLYQQALDLFPKSPIYHSNLALAYQELQKSAEAAQEWQIAFEMGPEFPSFEHQMENAKGQDAFKREDFRQALSHFMRAAELSPESDVYQSNLALTYQNLRDSKHAIQAWQRAVQLQPTNNEYQHQLLNAQGNEQFANGNYESARNYYSEAIKLAPNNAIYQANVALASEGLKDTVKCAESWERASALDPANSDFQERAKNAKGNLAMDKEDYETAITNYRDAIALASKNDIYHSNLALAYQGLNRPEDAASEFKIAGDLAPGNRDYVHQLKNALGNAAFAKADYVQAAQLYGEATALNSTNPIYFANLALANQEAGNLDKAIDAWEKAIELDPQNSDYSPALVNTQGSKAFASRDFPLAVTRFEKAVDLAPQNLVYRSNLELARQVLAGTTTPSVAPLNSDLKQDQPTAPTGSNQN